MKNQWKRMMAALLAVLFCLPVAGCGAHTRSTETSAETSFPVEESSAISEAEASTSAEEESAADAVTEMSAYLQEAMEAMAESSEEISGEIRPELQESMEELEAVSEELVDLYERYLRIYGSGDSSASDDDVDIVGAIRLIGMAVELQDLVDRLNTVIEEFNQLSEEDLNTAEQAYLIQALQRLSELAEEMEELESLTEEE